MKEMPILFSGPMVRAILNGRKTQTRRVARDVAGTGGFVKQLDVCPYGIPGDRLWVREQYWAWGKWAPNGVSASGRKKWKFLPVGGSLRFQENPPTKTAKRDGECGWVYRHARYMPKAHSRITLEITNVRVQRLQEISSTDSIFEGIRIPDEKPDGNAVFIPRDAYRELWDSINAKKHPWSSNPWVWVLTFKLLDDVRG